MISIQLFLLSMLYHTSALPALYLPISAGIEINYPSPHLSRRIEPDANEGDFIDIHTIIASTKAKEALSQNENDEIKRKTATWQDLGFSSNSFGALGEKTLSSQALGDSLVGLGEKMFASMIQEDEESAALGESMAELGSKMYGSLIEEGRKKRLKYYRDRREMTEMMTRLKIE
jgi:hypothetical protein